MSTFVLTSAWRQSTRLSHLSPTKLATSYFLSTKTSSVTGRIFMQIPKAELAPKTRPRLRDREFLPGSTGEGFPEFLAEPSDSFPHGVRVNTGDQSSISELLGLNPRNARQASELRGWCWTQTQGTEKFWHLLCQCWTWSVHHRVAQWNGVSQDFPQEGIFRLKDRLIMLRHQGILRALLTTPLSHQVYDALSLIQ